MARRGTGVRFGPGGPQSVILDPFGRPRPPGFGSPGAPEPEPEKLPSGIDKAKQQAIEAERRRIAQAKELKRQAKLQAEKLKRLRRGTAKERLKFFKEQKDLRTALNVQKLIEKGKKPTGKALETFDEVIKQQGINGKTSLTNFNQLVKNKQDKLPKQKETIIQKINRIGALTNRRKQILVKNNLNKRRDNIYNDLQNVLNKHTIPGTNEVNPFSKNYKDDLANVIAKYNRYKNDRGKFVNTIKGKVKAETEFDIAIGQDVLVGNIQDKGLDNAMDRLITKAQRNDKPSSADLQLAGLVAVKLSKDLLVGTILLPKTIASVLKDPKKLTQIPKAISEGGRATGQLLRISPLAGLVKMGGEVFFWTKAPGQALKLVKKVGIGGGRLTGLFKGVKTTPLGVQTIKKVKKVGDIEIILNRGEKLKVQPLKVIEETQIGKRLKLKPKLAPVNKIEKQVLDVVKKKGDVVTGGLARESLLKKQFTRKHKDLDIASKDIPALQKALKNKFGKRITFTKKPNSVLVKINGKEVVDLVPFLKAEAGAIKRFGTKKVSGLKLADPRALIFGKVTKLGKLKIPRSLKKAQKFRGRKQPKARAKVTKDIEKLTGQKALDRPALTGAFGFTKKEQAKLLGKKGSLTTSQADLLVKNLLKRNPKLKVERWLYATPWEVRTGKAQVRVSRLGLASEEATILDLLRGQASFFRKGKPQLFVLPKEKIFKAKGKLIKGKTIKTPKGFIVPNFSSELEVVLGKGFILKRGKVLRRQIIAGEIVPIIELKKIRIPKTIRKELASYNKLQNQLRNIVKKKKVKKGKLAKVRTIKKQNLVKKIDSKERALNVKIKKLTGFDYFSKPIKPKKVFPVSKQLVSKGRISRLRRGRKVSRRRQPSRRRKPTRILKPSRGVPGRPSRSIPSKPSRRLPSRPIKRPVSRGMSRVPPSRVIPKPLVPIPRRKKVKIKKKKKTKQVFNVFGKSKGKFRRLNKKPLTREDALSRGAFAVDQTTARTFKIQPAGKSKKPGALLKSEKNYFNRQGFKLREVRIRKGRKFKLKQKWIEKRRFGIDTRGEKKGLTLSRFLRGKKKVKRKATSKQLRSLAKARRVKKLKGGKK